MIDNYMSVQGWWNCEPIYHNAILQAKDGDNFLEVGTWLGRSTCFMGQMIRHLNKNIKFYTVDTFQGESTCQFQVDKVKECGGTIFNEFWRNVTDLGLENIIYPIITDSKDILKHVSDKKFKFMFLDGDHHYEFVKAEIENLWPLLVNGGFMTGHDYNSEVKQAVDEFAASKGLPVSSGYGCWEIIKP